MFTRYTTVVCWIEVDMILIIPIKDSLSIRIYRCTDKIAIGVAVFIVRSAVRKVLLTVGIIDNRFRSVR